MFTIDVAGSGVSSVKPDLAILHVSVTTKSIPEVLSAGPVTEENVKIVAKVLSNLEKFEVQEKDLATDCFRVFPEFDYNARKFVGFTAINSLTAKVRDLNKVGELCSELLGDKAIEFSVEFRVEKPKILEQKAREGAFADAKEKAEQLAELSGSKIVGVSALTDGQKRHNMVQATNHKTIAGTHGFSGYSGFSGCSGTSGFSGYSAGIMERFGGNVPLFTEEETMTLDIAVTFLADKS